MKWWYADGSEKRVIPCKECGVTQCVLNGSDDICPTCPIAEPKGEKMQIVDYDKNGKQFFRELKERTMEFDKSRVYTAVNADELRAGDKVIVADTMTELKEYMSKNIVPVILTGVLGEEWTGRFDLNGHNFNLAYLVERKENCTNCEGCGDYVDPRDDRERVMVCSEYKPKTELKAEKKEMCLNCKHYNKANDFRDCRLVDNPTGACPHYEAEKHYRPFKDTDELVKVWEKKVPCNGYRPANTMPLIWVRYKASGNSYLITGYFTNDNEVCFSATGFSMNDLLKDYEFLDGSVCGVEE